MLFHKSAIIFAVTYFVANMKLTQKNIALMLGSMFVIFFAADKDAPFSGGGYGI